jgi:hypothetical protein
MFLRPVTSTLTLDFGVRFEHARAAPLTKIFAFNSKRLNAGHSRALLIRSR